MPHSSVPQLKKNLGQTMLADRFSFQKRLTTLENEFIRAVGDRNNQSLQLGVIDETRLNTIRKKLEILSQDVTRSIALVNHRRKLRPIIQYDSELPICDKRDEIARLIRDNQVVVICGETGSGKSTQLPKICLELGRGISGVIGHTQPRRIAARSVAARIAEELSLPLGQGVGYKIRFADETGPNTLIKVMTDGILLAESQNDPFFNQYDTIIIDEAHERSLNIDFLLGMFKRVLVKRRDLKLIITSATIDAKRFAEHFSSAKGPAPIMEVSGRTWPIDILYRPLDELAARLQDESRQDDKPDDDDLFEKGLLNAVDEFARLGHGDMLIFMPTERDIFETAKLLKRHLIPGDDASRKTTILPLYARLPSTEQQKIFKTNSWRRIVIATNVAESSLTVPGIRYVIDPGTARISRYSARSRTQRLPIEPISQASADQRAGRCGRIGPGVCIRLFSELDYKGRERYTTPEIRRTNLASVILQTKALRLGAIERFPFIDPPSSASINEGYKTLFELKALDEKNELTEVGKMLGRLPVDPRIARMILTSHDENCLREMLIIAAVLEIQDPRERPLDAQQKADLAHQPFLDDTSDFLSFLKLWDFWQHLKENLSQSQLRKACRQNYLSYNRMKEWSDIHLQLMQFVREAKLVMNPRRKDNLLSDALHRSIMTGLLYAVARKTETVEYTVTGNAKFFIWPGSGLFKKKYEWILAAERVETSKKYLRTIAKIDSKWIEPLAEHLLVSTYQDPFWCRETGYVHAWQKVSLYGLTIIPKRRINYGPINPKEARLFFIQNGLIEREFDCLLDFFRINGEKLEEAKHLQAKLRHYQLLKRQEMLFDFFDARIPDDVYDSVTLTQWYRGLTQQEKKSLCFTLSDLCVLDIPDDTPALFPDRLETLQGANLPIEYQFKPGELEDGLSVIIPAEGLNQIDSRQTGWLVPGLLEQKITALLKTLPKEIRRELVPIPNTTKELLQTITFGHGDLLETLSRQVSQRVGRLVTPNDFSTDKLPNELVMNIRVIDCQGEKIAEGRHLEELQEKLGVKISQTIAATHDPHWHRDGLTRWDIGSLPSSLSMTRGRMNLQAYPALCDPRLLDEQITDLTQTVSLRLVDSPERALLFNRVGHTRLFVLQNKNDLKTQAKWIPDIQKHAVLLKSLPNTDLTTLCAELIGAIAVEMETMTIPANEGDFNRLVQKGKQNIGLATQEITRWIKPFALEYQAARLAIEKNRRLFPDAIADASAQMESFFSPFFYLLTPWTWLKEFPRYLKGIAVRFEKLQGGGQVADREATSRLRAYSQRYLDLLQRHNHAGMINPELELFRWMLEEYRISLFAQKLGTAVKISDVRLDKQWDKIILRG